MTIKFEETDLESFYFISKKLTKPITLTATNKGLVTYSHRNTQVPYSKHDTSFHQERPYYIYVVYLITEMGGEEVCIWNEVLGLGYSLFFASCANHSERYARHQDKENNLSKLPDTCPYCDKKIVIPV